jgi:hypothetical protein
VERFKMIVQRVIIVEGPKEWVEATLAKSFIQPNRPFEPSQGKSIKEVSRDDITLDEERFHGY